MTSSKGVGLFPHLTCDISSLLSMLCFRPNVAQIENKIGIKKKKVNRCMLPSRDVGLLTLQPLHKKKKVQRDEAVTKTTYKDAVGT